jgi:hypothetical protein
MNTKTLGLFLGLATLSGCIARNPVYSGNVQFTWTFSGLTCSQVPQVTSVQVIIPGEQLENNGVYPCLSANYPGILLHDFLPGTYNFTINALDSSGNTLFTGSGNFTINGDVRVAIDLTPVGGPTSYAYLSWTFPANSLSANPTCAQAGMDFPVDYVDVQIDQGQVQRYNCVDGLATPGVVTPYLNAGSHQITLSSISRSLSYPLHRFTGTLTTFSGNPISASYGLPWAVGGVAVSWQLSDGTFAQTCASAGITTVYTNFQDANGNNLYGGAGDPQRCTDGFFSASVRYNYLPSGSYRLFLQAVGSSGTYRTNFAVPPTVAIAPGQFANPSQPFTVTLIRGQ